MAGRTSNYSLISDAKIERRKLSDLLLPYEMYRVAYKAEEDKLDKLYDKAGAMDAMRYTDPELYAIYQEYNDELQSLSEDIYDGISLRDLQRRGSDLRRRYSNTVTPLLDAYAKKQQAITDENKLKEKTGGQYVGTIDPMTMDAKAWLGTNPPKFEGLSLVDVANNSKTLMSSLSNRKIKTEEGESYFGDTYRSLIKEKGFEPGEALSVILEKNPDLAEEVDNLKTQMGFDRFDNNPEAKAKLESALNTGLYSGLSYSRDVTLYQDPVTKAELDAASRGVIYDEQGNRQGNTNRQSTPAYSYTDADGNSYDTEGNLILEEEEEEEVPNRPSNSAYASIGNQPTASNRTVSNQGNYRQQAPSQSSKKPVESTEANKLSTTKNNGNTAHGKIQDPSKVNYSTTPKDMEKDIDDPYNVRNQINGGGREEGVATVREGGITRHPTIKLYTSELTLQNKQDAKEINNSIIKPYNLLLHSASVRVYKDKQGKADETSRRTLRLNIVRPNIGNYSNGEAIVPILSEGRTVIWKVKTAAYNNTPEGRKKANGNIDVDIVDTETGNLVTAEGFASNAIEAYAKYDPTWWKSINTEWGKQEYARLRLVLKEYWKNNFESGLSNIAGVSFSTQKGSRYYTNFTLKNLENLKNNIKSKIAPPQIKPLDVSLKDSDAQDLYNQLTYGAGHVIYEYDGMDSVGKFKTKELADKDRIKLLTTEKEGKVTKDNLINNKGIKFYYDMNNPTYLIMVLGDAKGKGTNEKKVLLIDVSNEFRQASGEGGEYYASIRRSAESNSNIYAKGRKTGELSRRDQQYIDINNTNIANNTATVFTGLIGQFIAHYGWEDWKMNTNDPNKD